MDIHLSGLQKISKEGCVYVCVTRTNVSLKADTLKNGDLDFVNKLLGKCAISQETTVNDFR